MPVIDVQQLIDSIHQLQKLREELLRKDLSPPGAWIHEYEVQRFYAGSGNTEWYRYAKWQAHDPIFPRRPKRKYRLIAPDAEHGFTRHQHISRVSSTTGLGMEPEVQAAYQAWHNRQRLDALEQLLEEIQAILGRAKKLQGRVKQGEDQE